jgi:hypothetical protein
MQRDGLLTVTEDRRIQLTPAGRSAATRVMRKHRLAECLLIDVLGLEWQLAHVEACRWQHVMSEAVERRLLDILGHPTQSPYGNPIPGLAELGEKEGDEIPGDMVALTKVPQETGRVIMHRIGEPIHGAADPAAPSRVPAERGPGGEPGQREGPDRHGPAGGRTRPRHRRPRVRHDRRVTLMGTSGSPVPGGMPGAQDSYR